MNRCARFFRTMGGLLLLVQLAAVFLPVLKISQENYPTIRYSQFDFIKRLCTGELSVEQIIAVVFLILLPVLLAMVMGVIGIVGSNRQIISCIGSVFVAGLNAAFFFRMKVLEPARINSAQEYEKDFGLWLLLGLSLAAAVCGIAGLLVTPRRRRKETEVQETQESGLTGKSSEMPVQPKAAIEKVQESALSSGPSLGSEQTLEPRGVMIGLSGDYEGAEIPFGPGETLKIGRDISNDLVLANAQRVSRFHCTLTWLSEEKKFQIVDKSSNGSFINGLEECLPQNIAIYLEPGTILDIGNEQNRFRLE